MWRTQRQALAAAAACALLAACGDPSVDAVKKMPSAVPGRTLGQVLDDQPFCSQRSWQKAADPQGQGRVSARYECVIKPDAALRQRLGERARKAVQDDADFLIRTALRQGEAGTLKMYLPDVDRLLAQPELETSRPGATVALTQLRNQILADIDQLAGLAQACAAELRVKKDLNAQAAQDSLASLAQVTERVVFSVATPERLASQVTLLRGDQALPPSVRHEQPLLQGMQHAGQKVSNERDDPELRQLATWLARAALQLPDDAPLPCSQREAMDRLANTRPPISQVLQNLPAARP
jgi:hypothetical protein